MGRGLWIDDGVWAMATYDDDNYDGGDDMYDDGILRR